MVRIAAVLALLAIFPAPLAYGDARSDARAQVEFGIQVAQRGLWREAIYRWEKAIALDPTYAAAHNNLAVAYEQDGQFEKAQLAYTMALELDPGNPRIRENFDLFREINDRRNSPRE